MLLPFTVPLLQTLQFSIDACGECLQDESGIWVHALN